MKRRTLYGLASVAIAIGAAVVAVAALNQRGEEPLPASGSAPAFRATPQQVKRGAYLARAGNCMGCHTAPGGTPFAGGRGIATPFGTVYGGNLTPDAATGIGAWTPAEFWRALHNGRGRDGRLLVPAFPYTNYTHVTRDDADALYAYLHSLPPVVQPRAAHTLRFPYNTQVALAVWRALYFTPATPGEASPADGPKRSAEWQRGEYLVRGLGHCAACHAPRDALGGFREGGPLSGGRVPGLHWFAPALDAATEGGVADWPAEEVVALLGIGTAPRATVSGPMAEVVFQSTQHLTAGDLQAMAVYLQALPAHDRAPVPSLPPPAAVMARGERIYGQQCAQCHGEAGEGQAGAFPPLAGNRAVLLHDPTNLVRTVLQGGYLPATAGNPRPHGMPPFMQVLGDEDVAAVITFVRNAWGNQAANVGTMDVYRARERRAGP